MEFILLFPWDKLLVAEIQTFITVREKIKNWQIAEQVTNSYKGNLGVRAVLVEELARTQALFYALNKHGNFL